MTTSSNTTPERAPRLLELAHTPDGTSWTDRENLTDILERDLLGPAHGDDEVLEAQPDALYLVGRIAPAKLRDAEDPATELDAEDSDDALATDGAHAVRGVPVPDLADDRASSADDTPDDTPPRRGVMAPSSMGLRFQVPRDQDVITVRASWGTYRAEIAEQESSEAAEGAHPRRLYRRTPHEHTRTLPVGSYVPKQTATVELEDRVVLRVDVLDRDDMRIVELALCNDRETPPKIPVDAWLYQTRLFVEHDSDVFLPVRDITTTDDVSSDAELARLELQYRDRLEFAVGRTCSVGWAPMTSNRRTTRVFTEWLPTTEVPQVDAPAIDGAMLDMHVLAAASTPARADELRHGLTPIVRAYAEWLDEQEQEAAKLPAHLSIAAADAIEDARLVAKRLEAGVDFLVGNEDALLCFSFMNRVMADQRVQTQAAALRAKDQDLAVDDARDRVLKRGPKAHSWRMFQLAFVLMQLETLAHPEHERRSDAAARAELLFFPTGGGKTEAYLGLAAFTFAMRRRQGVVETPEGPLDGNLGITVLMRYTLRLLTAQQFQRATALVCAAEVARREEPSVWGEEPFRIGLWVGTSVSPKTYDDAKHQLENAHKGHRHGLTVLQFKRCPWCGTSITAKNVKGDDDERRIRVYCGEEFGECPFSEGGDVEDGLPVLTVDEEIYRLVPTYVIATVDKFARLTREGEAAALFGYVQYRCDLHGYVHEDSKSCQIKTTGKHPKTATRPALGKNRTGRLRPPDLIIQDELHLITGALGTTVGAFEIAIDTLCTWQGPNGRQVRPLVVASTATVRNAAEQIRALYGRRTAIFPPQVLDVADTFFSREVPPSAERPGRRYVGVSTTGVRLTTAEITVASTLLSTGQLLLDKAVPPADGGIVSADPYLTLVGYFNATRELAGMARYVSDDIQTAIQKRRPGKFFPQRYGTGYGQLNYAELTSRAGSSDITATLDDMATPFSPTFDSTAGRRAMSDARKAGEKVAERAKNPHDVVLATSMLQVGVDVDRLGLMMMVGQPKNTAEYIQASSRVGRSADRPGLVVTLSNWARPRDLAHFEQFRHYHETFYSQVEPLSITPFSVTSLDRSVAAILVAAARVLDAPVDDGLSPEKSAGRIEEATDRVATLIERLAERARWASDDSTADLVTQRLENRVGQWKKRRLYVKAEGKSLVYERVARPTDEAPLMVSLEEARTDLSSSADAPFALANSMREVQPEINLLVSPLHENRLAPELREGEPAWAAATTKGAGSD